MHEHDDTALTSCGQKTQRMTKRSEHVMINAMLHRPTKAGGDSVCRKTATSERASIDSALSGVCLSGNRNLLKTLRLVVGHKFAGL
jgi:hypothetical protein